MGHSLVFTSHLDLQFTKSDKVPTKDETLTLGTTTRGLLGPGWCGGHLTTDTATADAINTDTNTRTSLGHHLTLQAQQGKEQEDYHYYVVSSTTLSLYEVSSHKPTHRLLVSNFMVVLPRQC